MTSSSRENTAGLLESTYMFHRMAGSENFTKSFAARPGQPNSAKT
jgi:hypothetical protein